MHCDMYLACGMKKTNQLVIGMPACVCVYLGGCVCVCAKTIERVSNHIQIFWGQLWKEEVAALGVVKLSVKRCMNCVAY